MKLLIIGGGIIGTMHAYFGIQAGFDVVQIEREAHARSASLRNFGLVWVSGRSNLELEPSLKAYELWKEIGTKIPEIGFRANGSITLFRNDLEKNVALEASTSSTAKERELKLLSRNEVQKFNPALNGEFIGGLFCGKDAAVESRVAILKIHEYLDKTGKFKFLSNTEARNITKSNSLVHVNTANGETLTADQVIVCPGATLTGLMSEVAGDLGLRRVRLQMMQTEPLDKKLTTSIADADSFRYYPGFAGPALDELNRKQPQHDIAAKYAMQLLCVQRLNGELTIGDTHHYDEPFDFDLQEAPYSYLKDVVENFLSAPMPQIKRRWAGVYSQTLDKSKIVARKEVDPQIIFVAGPGGRGMTLSPFIGQETITNLKVSI